LAGHHCRNPLVHQAVSGGQRRQGKIGMGMHINKSGGQGISPGIYDPGCVGIFKHPDRCDFLFLHRQVCFKRRRAGAVNDQCIFDQNVVHFVSRWIYEKKSSTISV
jgi:hypothetical protein